MSFASDYETANEYCSKEHGGAMEQWRLPSKTELAAVARDTVIAVFGWQHPQRFFWTQASPDLKRALLIMPSLDPRIAPDEAYEDRATFRGGVTCVRRAFGCSNEVSGFQTGNSGCYHHATGMTWSNISPGPVSILRADTYCKQLKQNGFTDWRLPEGNQLAMIGRSGIEALFGASFQDRIWGTGLEAKFSEGRRALFHHRIYLDPNTAITKMAETRDDDAESDGARVACVR